VAAAVGPEFAADPDADADADTLDADTLDADTLDADFAHDRAPDDTAGSDGQRA
jgi:hypothetical protein